MQLQGAAFRVLACFYEADMRSFSELCQMAGYPTDLGGYYIRQLISAGHIQKEERGQYRILPKGKRELAVHYGKNLHASWPRVVALLVVQVGEQYAVLRRRVQPFPGAAEWPASAVEHGETAPEAAARVAKKRLATDVVPLPAGFFRRIDKYGDTIFDDKLFLVHTLLLPSGTPLPEKTELGEYELYSRDELSHVEHASRALLDIAAYVESGTLTLQEKVYPLTPDDVSLAEEPVG
jgi:8-oxo-dGTP pyrophosphatase MutT (NUDIX family)